MAFFSFFSRKPTPRKTPPVRRRATLGVEGLEHRATPAVISGYVYHDVNNNGIYDSGESPIGGVSLQLKSNTTNQIVATAVSDASGFYQFTNDGTISTNPTSITKTVSFPDTDLGFDLTGEVDKFDPSLGTLNSIDIIHDGTITSRIRVENTSNSQGSTITGTIGGNLQLVAPGVNDTLSLSQNAGSVTVTKYDGGLDFQGTSGADFGSKTASNSKTITVNGSALSQWQGTGKVSIQEIATATSSTSGGGNVTAAITSTGRSTITVRYNYTPGAGLRPGPYTILETQPASYIDGKDALGGVPIPNSHTTDVIVLTLATSDLTNNNFGEVRNSSLSGYVYVDANDNGIKESSELPLSGVVVTLTGFTDNGPLTQTATTDASGFYQFTNLRPGSYGLQEGAVPAPYVDGKDTIGSQGGTTGNDAFTSITLNSGVNGVNNNFGELKLENSDVGIVKTAGSSFVNINDTLTYTLTITNYGVAVAKDLVVSDVIPSGTTLLSASGNGWSIFTVGTGFNATMSSLAVGASTTITVQIRVPAVSSTITNTATVTTSTPDNNPNNNTSTVRTPVVVPPKQIGVLQNVKTPEVLLGKGYFTTGVLPTGPANNTQNLGFLNATYQTILGRQADAMGLNHFMNALAKGATYGQIAETIYSSDENHFRRVDTLYQSILNRAPTTAERVAGINMLKYGPSDAALSRQLYTSAEFANLYPKSANLFGALYLGVTGTLPTETQNAGVVSAIGNTTLDSIVASIQTSDDGFRNVITAAYREVLKRNADSSEVDFWLGQMKYNGMSQDGLRMAFMRSDEFRYLGARTVI